MDTGSCDNIAEYAAMGYNFVNVESDVTALARVYKSVLKKSEKMLYDNQYKGKR